MSFHKLKDGRWIVQYRKGTIKDAPERTREYFGRGIDGEKKARERDKELDNRPWKRRTPKNSSPLFFELVNAYLESRVGIIEQSTMAYLKIKMANVILPELGQTPAIKLNPRRFDQYVAKRLKTQKTTTICHGPGGTLRKKKPITGPDGAPAYIKRSTVHRELCDIQAVLNWSVANKYLTHNPAAGYQKPKRDDEIIAPPTADETRRLLKQAPPHLLRALVISYYTGIRPGHVELLTLKWTDVDFGAGSIFIRSAKKNGPRSRSVPLHKDFADLLRKWRALDESNGAGEYIVQFRGRPVKTIISSFKTAKKNAGISRRLRPYDFRHAFATAALRAGSDLKATSELLGHSRPDTTTRIYQHVDTELKRDVIEKLPPLDW